MGLEYFLHIHIFGPSYKAHLSSKLLFRWGDAANHTMQDPAAKSASQGRTISPSARAFFCGHQGYGQVESLREMDVENVIAI